MGKERRKANGLKTFVFNVDMHRKCNGCIKKINDGMKRISLSEGVEWADLMVDKAEVKVVGTMDPEKLCCLSHEVTKKHVKIRTQSTVSEGGTATSQQTRDSFSLESSSGVTPSAPPLAETWSRQSDVHWHVSGHLTLVGLWRCMGSNLSRLHMLQVISEYIPRIDFLFSVEFWSICHAIPDHWLSRFMVRNKVFFLTDSTFAIVCDTMVSLCCYQLEVSTTPV